MKNFILLSIWFIIFYTWEAYSQCRSDYQITLSNNIAESANGAHISPHGKLRMLIILAEVHYDVGVDPYPTGSTSWQPGNLPLWVNDIVDLDILNGSVAQKPLSRYYQLASSDDFKLVGDVLLAPNTGIFKVKLNTVPIKPIPVSIRNLIGDLLWATIMTGSEVICDLSERGCFFRQVVNVV